MLVVLIILHNNVLLMYNVLIFLMISGLLVLLLIYGKNKKMHILQIYDCFIFFPIVLTFLLTLYLKAKP